MNITTRVAVTVLVLFAICSNPLAAFADIIPVSSPAGPPWEPQEPRQEFVVMVYAFVAEQTGTVDAEAFNFNNPKNPDTFKINSDPKQFIKQIQAQYSGFDFSVISSGSKVCSNQEPCSFKVAPKPDDPTLTPHNPQPQAK